MAGGHTQVADMIIPQAFTGMVQERLLELTDFVDSGILTTSGVLNTWMEEMIGSGGGGSTLRRPTWNDLDPDDAERTGTDDESPLYTGPGVFPAPDKITTHEEIAVRVNRNNHWSATQMANVLAATRNPDAISAIANLVATWWKRRLQRMVIATLGGVFADNAANDSGDMTVSLAALNGGVFLSGTTNFTAPALYDALQTMGDADSQITTMCVHSVVRNGMRKQNLIEDIRDSDGNFRFEAYQNLRLVVDDGLPTDGSGLFTSYLFKPGALEFGDVPPENATTTVWRDEAGNGQGSKELWNRVQWSVHPMGFQYTAAVIPDGGPLNGDAATVNTLGHAASWNRVAQSRKNVGLISLVTREF